MQAEPNKTSPSFVQNKWIYKDLQVFFPMGKNFSSDFKNPADNFKLQGDTVESELLAFFFFSNSQENENCMGN